MSRLRKDYEIGIARVNALCAEYLANPKNLLLRQPASKGYDDDGLFVLVTPSEVGDIWVKFVLIRDDPSDPGLEVVSAHKPERPWP